MGSEKRDIQFRINNRDIGQGNPAYIIAEMSGNHAGSLERAKEIIHAAKESGADCIKIQTYTPDTLTIDCHNQYFRVQGGTWEGENLYGLYGKAYTPWEWQPLLKEEADKIGIDFLSTPFDKTSVDFLEEMGLSFYKIASFEMIDLPLLRYVAEKGKPIIMSTGMGSLEEIKEAVEAVTQMGNKQLALLKCSSVYPADPARMNLATIKDLQERFSLPIGLSDHSMGSLSAATAVALGASIIEKHFCISREIENPDASFSMTPGEFKQMITDIRNVEAALGKPTYGVTKQEESSMIFRRSVFVVKDIAAGEKITEDNVRIIRPGFGVKPKYLSDILTMRAGVSLERGTPVSFDAMEKGAVLFLTNNENTNDLYEWLCEKEEKVYRIENKLTLEMVRQLVPSYIVSFNYRHIIPMDVLDEMEGRVINLHTSYLPYNRGSSPNFFSFWDNTPKGVTIHKMDEGLDTGDILCQKELFFDEGKETFATTYEILLKEIKKLFIDSWEDIKSGKIMPREQVGEGTCHRMKELEAIRNEHPFSWNDVIADVKKKCGV
ncbi:MAG: pseudaminic acid synthase [Lachnospiraceae bacterium]|nr:pseudaminic acid synthase [Lachnospiraceae bacterium]